MECEKTCQRFGFRAVLLPKFHCDLNFVELEWAWLKRSINSALTGNVVTLMRQLIIAVNAVPRQYYESWTRRCERYLRGYQLGLDASHIFTLVKLMTGSGGKGTAKVSHCRPGVIDPEDEEGGEEEPGGMGAAAAAAAPLLRHYCDRCAQRDSTVVQCTSCKLYFHSHCLMAEGE